MEKTTITETPRIIFFSSSEINMISGSQTWLHIRIVQGAFKSFGAKVTHIPTKSEHLGVGDNNVQRSLGTNELNCKQRDQILRRLLQCFR